jgi:hypothetical protein
MRLRKIDPLLAETLSLRNCVKIAKSYWEIECPFCLQHSLVYDRNFAKGCRCTNPECRAMFRKCLNQAMRDMVPAKEARNG